MRTAATDQYSATGSWSILDRHDWNGPESIVMTLHDAIQELDGVDEDVVVYDHVDVEAIEDVLEIDSDARGAHSVRFYCGENEIQVFANGTIAARPRPE